MEKRARLDNIIIRLRNIDLDRSKGKTDIKQQGNRIDKEITTGIIG